MTFYAHSVPGKPTSEWQPLDTHLKNAAAMAKEFAEPFGAGEWGYSAGWLHDLGKAAVEFQGYLKSANGLDDEDYDGTRVNHSSAGAAYALASMFEHDRSAARGLMSTRKLIVFKHATALGNAPAHQLFERVQIKRKDESKPPRAFSDYDVTLDGKAVDAAVKQEVAVG